MLAEIFIYIAISLLFLSTLIFPVGNYYSNSSKDLAHRKIDEKIEYIKTKSKNELSDYVILADKDYVFISNTRIEPDEDEFYSEVNEEEKFIIENIVDQFKLERKYYENKLDESQKKYRGYRVIAEFRNGGQVYP